MVVPALLFFAAFAIYPTIRVFYLSFFHYDLTSPEQWAGLGNYQELVTDSLFHTAALNTAVYVVGTYVPVVVLALVIAVGLNHRSGIAGTLRTAYFIPVAMSWVVVSVMWTLIFHPYGLLNQVTGLHLNWLTDSRWAPAALIIMSVWKELGFFLIIFLAGLQSISRELYEAAAIDGAGVLRAHLRITLPLLRPVLAVASIFAVIRGMQAFTPQYVMTGGGPGAATEVLNLYVYKTAFTYAQMGKASAVAVLLFGVLLVATLLQLRVFRTRDA
jgi:ABC-type sugar transport system permease subunit